MIFENDIMTILYLSYYVSSYQILKNLLLSLNKYFAIVPGQLRPYRKIVLILALLSTVFMGYGTTRFVLDTSLLNLGLAKTIRQ